MKQKQELFYHYKTMDYHSYEASYKNKRIYKTLKHMRTNKYYQCV